MTTMTQYTRAIDEIFEIRRGFAYESGVLETSLTFKSFPKSRREFTQGQVVRFRALARGDKAALHRYTEKSSGAMRSCLLEVGTLSDTRNTWEAEVISREIVGFVDTETPPDEYGCAVNEVLSLRRAAAYEQRVVGIALMYLTYPKSRRTITSDQVERLSLVAQGKVQFAYAGMNGQFLQGALADAGARVTLTRSEYESERG